MDRSIPTQFAVRNEKGGITAITGDYGYEPNGVIHDMTNFPEIDQQFHLDWL